MMTKEQIKIEQLTTGYATKKEEKLISTDLNLSVHTEELVLLMGPNGCGKSTLMNTISGIIPPLSGKISILGKSLDDMNPRELAQALSLVLTDRIHAPQLKIKDIVSVGRHPYIGQLGILSKSDKMIIAEAIDQCNLKGYENRNFVELSDGEKQRVMIARALAQDTPVMLLDEPTAHLDLPSRLEILVMLKKLTRDAKKSVFVSTHELDLALQWGDTIWLMDRSGKLCCGAPEDLILSGDIERVFGRDGLIFDRQRGEFRIEQKGREVFFLDGTEELSLLWTERALRRSGFGVTRSAQHHQSEISANNTISIKGKEWIYCNRSYQSLHTLLSDLLGRKSTL